MSNAILDDLNNQLEQIRAREREEVQQMGFPLSGAVLFLPGNEKGELVGLDSEVLAFYARQTFTEFHPSSALNPGEYYLMPKSIVLDLDSNQMNENI